MTNTKPMPTIGVDKYTFFNVVSDDIDGISYGKAYSVPGTVEIAPTDAGGSEIFDADNGQYITETYLEKLGHDITNADITPEIDALWRGLERKNGAVVVSGVDKTVYFGTAWRILKADGTYRYVKYFKGSYSFASNVGGKTKPSSGAADKQTAKATYNAVQTDYMDLKYMYIDEADALENETYATREEFEAAWFGDMATLLDDEKVTTVTE
jgi:phi13 family phage major tail protein